jgi:hypothetical protein
VDVARALAGARSCQATRGVLLTRTGTALALRRWGELTLKELTAGSGSEGSAGCGCGPGFMIGELRTR